MFELMRGRVVSATAGKDSAFVLRFNQAFTLMLLAVPFGAVIFAIVLLVVNPPGVMDLALLASFFFATALGISVGFHRLITHGAFKTNPVVKAVLLIFGTWAIQGAAITWASIHSKHHALSDDEGDPHTPVKSFWKGHMGWLFTTLRGEPEQYAQSQLKDPMVMFFSRTALWWAILGLVLPGLIGAGFLGWSWTGFLWGGLVRLFLVHHATWGVNSVCHTFGSRPFDAGGKDVSTNHWIFGLLASGEGWHNNHHAFPRSAFIGLRWREVDLGGYVIRLMRLVGLARDVNSPSKQDIEAKRRAPVAT
ncbi:MAG: fatty acid desaturase [Dehalococcoidia bacterium]